jgi:hypothetical protein
MKKYTVQRIPRHRTAPIIVSGPLTLHFYETHAVIFVRCGEAVLDEQVIKATSSGELWQKVARWSRHTLPRRDRKLLREAYQNRTYFTIAHGATLVLDIPNIPLQGRLT